MRLYDICEHVIDIEEGLMYGTISFTYDNLMSAIKPGHPMEILDSMLSEIFWDAQAGTEPSMEHLENVLKNFKEFKKCFKVKEMARPIKELSAYIADRKSKETTEAGN